MVEIVAMRWLSAALMVVLKSTLLLLATVAAARFLRRLSAAARHLVWLASLLAVLAIPLLSFLLPRWTVGLPMPAGMDPLPVGGPLFAVPLPARGAPTLAPQASTSAALAASPSAVRAPRPGRAVYWLRTLFALWLAGVLAICGRTLHGIRGLWRLERGSCGAAAGLVAVAAAVREQIGMRRRIRLLTAPPGAHSVLPMTWGLWRPVVLLPAGAGEWPEKRLRAVLMHELAHVRRNDWLAQMTAEAALAVYWFHPLVWWTAARRRLESERACDDQVLAWGISPSEYATYLLEVVRMAKTTRTFAGPAATMAASPDIERRLRGVLDPHCRRGEVSRKALFLAAAAAVGLLLPMAALRVRPADAAPPNRTAPPAMSAPSAEGSAGERAELAALRARLAETHRVMDYLHRQLDAVRTELRQSQARSAALQARTEQQRAEQRRQLQLKDQLQLMLLQQSRARAEQDRSRSARTAPPPDAGRGAEEFQQQMNRRKLELFANRLVEIELQLVRLQSSSTHRPDTNPEVHDLTRERAILLSEVERLTAMLRQRDEAERQRDRRSDQRVDVLQRTLVFVEMRLAQARRKYKDTDPEVRDLEAKRKDLQLRLEAEGVQRRAP